MRDLLLALSEKSWLRESIRCLGFLIVAIAMTWPLAAELDQSLLGYPTMDSQDTVTLRGLIAAMLFEPEAWPLSTGVYYPVGYPILLLTPNLLDHLTAAPFIWVFPFPLSDNLWWLTVLVLNGWTAHRLGRRIGQIQKGRLAVQLGLHGQRTDDERSQSPSCASIHAVLGSTVHRSDTRSAGQERFHATGRHTSRCISRLVRPQLLVLGVLSCSQQPALTLGHPKNGLNENGRGHRNLDRSLLAAQLLGGVPDR